ncbi:gluconate 2-dehydrogenase subunit 3 family protein [Rhizobium sp. P38BS-XIX]|uniref:gluconate 2-dehydrogenase subunit 3 family protein n=1 Tax=Rhizobium sp. P38BS-XIX TaxID=2726740 RepID=UPI0014563336|nr:gluconate 2-dehydrogenase subunit 3 family protein [Rhizobium sp. P38BS-XIX]NLS00735.1 gluconate 2-dehydrogenase subunit 3 family protein [Rhizobium sp. P38BS-XIX]
MSHSNTRAFRLETFRAVLDRIIPRDEFPSATDNGVDRFILRLWDAGLIADTHGIELGLRSMDERASTAFETLLPDEQDLLLAQCEKEAWFRTLCELAAEGFYADPANGANPGAISWQMVGYRPGLPEGPSGPGENPQDAVRGRLWA